MGWYAMALVDSYEELDKAEKTNYLETSGTATFAAALMKGYNLGVLIGEKYYNAGLNAFNALTDYKLENSGLKDICKSAGLAGNDGSSLKSGKTTTDNTSPKNNHNQRDGSYDYYLNEPIVTNDAKGAAPYLMAYAQKLLHDKNAAKN